MTNKPEFNLIKNMRYAYEGMLTVLRSEKSFRTQLLVIAVVGVGLLFVDLSVVAKAILFVSTWLVLFAEAINSSIERVVDLVTTDYHELAKQAKDIGAFFVALSLVIVVGIWVIVLYVELFS